MTDFTNYIATEHRIQRLSALQRESLATLSAQTDRRMRLEARLRAVQASEERERVELQAITARIAELTTESQEPFNQALSAADKNEVSHVDLADDTTDETQTLNTIVNGPVSLNSLNNDA